ncbi:MAG: hypothetical protein ABIP21_09620 [Acidimicrobiia bacterium]
MRRRRAPLDRPGIGSVALLIAAVAIGGCSSGSVAADKPRPQAATTPEPAKHVHLDLVDRTRPAVDPIGVRNAPVRSLPAELYLPNARGPVPLIVFAHGYDGDPSKFTQLFEHWSDAGFAVVAPRFPITSTGAATGPLSRAADYAEQPVDLAFVLDAVLASRWKSHIDAENIGAAGLSLGGATIWGFIGNSCCRDERIKAAIVMDGIQFDFNGGTRVANRMPLLMFHADHDYALPYTGAVAAYATAAAPKYFVTILGAFHAEPYENMPNIADDMVMRTTNAFWRAYLLGDTAARGEIVPDATVAGMSAAVTSTE